MEIKKLKTNISQYDVIKDFVQEILDLNYQYKDIDNTLSYYGKEFNSNLFINNEFNNLENFINHILDAKDTTKLLNGFLNNDVRLVKIYFTSILDHSYRPHSKKINNDNLQVALNKLFDNYKELEEIIFKYGAYALLAVENSNNAYFMNYNNTQYLHYVKVKDTCFKVFPSQFLNNVWKKYNDKLIKRAHRGPKMMLILYFLYAQFFTPKMIDILIDRMKGYKNLFYIDYLVKCTKYLNQDQINKLNALKLTLKLL